MQSFQRVWKALKSDKGKQKKLLLIGAPVLVAVVCIVFVLTRQPSESGVVGSSPSDLGLTQVEAEFEENDILASVLTTGEYDGTILEKTKDAGATYVKETLFIGDSNTAGMINNTNTTNVSLSNGIGVVSMGISHVTSLNCVSFQGMSPVVVPEAVKIMQPRRILINFGTNDYYMKPEQFAEAYKKSLEAIQKAYPYSEIIIGSIFPITSNCSYYTVSMPTIEKFNLELVKLAKDKNLHFLNWSEVLKDPKTGYCKPEYMAGDGVHLSKKGMEQIFEYFRTHQLDDEDTRPKPLNSIPGRLPNPPGLLGVGLVDDDKEDKEPEEEIVQGTVTVTFIASPGGLVNGSSAITLEVAPGTTVGATATPLSGYRFLGWSGAASSASPSISFAVPANATQGQAFGLSAVFELIPTTEDDTSQGNGGGETPPGGGGEGEIPPGGGGEGEIPPGGGGEGETPP